MCVDLGARPDPKGELGALPSIGALPDGKRQELRLGSESNPENDLIHGGRAESRASTSARCPVGVVALDQ
jgi:hypothetical protein